LLWKFWLQGQLQANTQPPRTWNPFESNSAPVSLVLTCLSIFSLWKFPMHCLVLCFTESFLSLPQLHSPQLAGGMVIMEPATILLTSGSISVAGWIPCQTLKSNKATTAKWIYLLQSWPFSDCILLELMESYLFPDKFLGTFLIDLQLNLNALYEALPPQGMPLNRAPPQWGQPIPQFPPNAIQGSILSCYTAFSTCTNTRWFIIQACFVRWMLCVCLSGCAPGWVGVLIYRRLQIVWECRQLPRLWWAYLWCFWSMYCRRIWIWQLCNSYYGDVSQYFLCSIGCNVLNVCGVFISEVSWWALVCEVSG
jgi:hypothetical protein